MLEVGFEQADELDQPLDGVGPVHARQTLYSRRRALLAALVSMTLLGVFAGWAVIPALSPNVPQDWHEVARQVLVGWLALATLVWVTTSRAVARHVGTATPGALGGCG